MLDRASAEAYAACFRALGDPTRVQIVSLLAAERRPMTVGEITGAMNVVQSTVSHHLKALASIHFVVVTHVGTTSLYAINDRCVECFPTAADIVTGRRSPASAGVQGWDGLR